MGSLLAQIFYWAQTLLDASESSQSGVCFAYSIPTNDYYGKGSNWSSTFNYFTEYTVPNESCVNPVNFSSLSNGKENESRLASTDAHTSI